MKAPRVTCPKCEHQFSVLEIPNPFTCESCGVELKTSGNATYAAIDVALQFFVGLIIAGCFASGHVVGYVIGALLIVGWMWFTLTVATRVISVHLKEPKNENGNTAI